MAAFKKCQVLIFIIYIFPMVRDAQKFQCNEWDILFHQFEKVGTVERNIFVFGIIYCMLSYILVFSFRPKLKMKTNTVIVKVSVSKVVKTFWTDKNLKIKKIEKSSMQH